MAAKIKQDLNRSGWESTDFPSVCERCLPDNPYVQMLKSEYDAECKICTRPFTLFTFKADRTARQKKTAICLTCARLKNCCQVCMLDLSFGLPLAVRDAALKMVAPGPQSTINREYYAQVNEKAIAEGHGPVKEYEQTNDKAVELLRRLAESEPYRRRNRIEPDDRPADPDQDGSTSRGQAGPVRTRENRTRTAISRAGGDIGGKPKSKPIPRHEIDPPADEKVVSLFVTGVEDDLAEYHIRNFFSTFGPLRSVVCSHRAHCAFINFRDRKDAEAAAAACQGVAIVDGRPLRVRWGKPKTLDSMEKDERIANVKEGRFLGRRPGRKSGPDSAHDDAGDDDDDDGHAVRPPPGAEPVQYASLAGE